MTRAQAQPLIEQLERAPEQFAAALKSLDSKTLKHKPAPGKWCIQEIMAHLADVEVVQGHRVRQALAEGSNIVPMDQDKWAASLGYMEWPAAEALDTYRALRRATVRLLKRLSDDDLQRGGFHPELGRPLTVGEIIERLAKHDPNHLKQMESIKQAVGASR